LQFGERPVIAKIHGTIGRGMQDRDSFVITENHYIDYLSHTDIAQLIPVNIALRLRKSHFLFLGYSLNDWNLRVILHRLWVTPSWAGTLGLCSQAPTALKRNLGVAAAWICSTLGSRNTSVGSALPWRLRHQRQRARCHDR
jgi:hypothetical protein